MLNLKTSWILCALLASLMVAAPTVADTEDADAAKPEIDLEELNLDRMGKAMRHQLRKRVSRYLASAGDKAADGEPDEAERMLARLSEGRLNPLEEAYVNRMHAFIKYGANQPEEAIPYFEKVLALQVLPIKDENRIRFNIVQLSAQLERWQDVIDWLDEWFSYSTQPDPLGYYLLAIAHYQLEAFEASIAAIKQGIDASTPPPEPWLRLLAALYSQVQQYEKAAPVLEELLLRYPKKQYWVQLALIHGARDEYGIALAVQQVAYEKGYLTEDAELQRLARSYLYQDLPYPAARVLERGLADGMIDADSDAYELLANSFIASREYDRALPSLEKAAKLSPDGNLFVRYGQVHMQRENWDAAAENFEEALKRGGLKDPGNAELLLGISHYNQARIASARRHFGLARKHDSTRAEADRWLTHIATEQSSAGAG